MYDVVVVGGGLFGSATAYHLGKRGLNVALVEQHDLLHRCGSSHGESRICRRTYVQRHYSKMMRDAYTLWDELEAETGQQLLHKIGGVDYGLTASPQIHEVIQSCEENGVEYERLSPEQLWSRFKIRVSDDYTIIYQKDTGVLSATKAVAAFQAEAKKHGVAIFDRTPIVAIHCNASFVAVDAKDGRRFVGKKMVLCPGPWAVKALGMLGLKPNLHPMKITVTYFAESATLPESEAKTVQKGAKVPIFIHYDYEGIVGYGIPSDEFKNHIKVGVHYGPHADPDERTFEPDAGAISEIQERLIRPHFPTYSSTPTVSETCMYTMTDDEDFVIDHHPRHNNVVIAAGFSGHGFKFGPLVGKMLADMAMDKETGYDMTPFRIERVLK